MMQTHGGEDVEKVILSEERSFIIRLKVDWMRNGEFYHTVSDLSHFASEISTDSSLAGSAPSEIMLVEGSSAAELSFVVGGDWWDTTNHRRLPFTAVFSPYNGYSPLYGLNPIGCEVIYDIGVETALGIVWYPQFRGQIRTISPRRSANEVTITALDKAETLRQPVSLPNWAIASMQSARGYEIAQLCDSQWVMDQALRSADIAAGPLRAVTHEEVLAATGNPDFRGDIHLWVTGNGSYIPNIGTLDNARVQGFPRMETTGNPMYLSAGIPHPDSPTPEVRPMVLGAMGNDTSGIVPAQQPAASDDRLKSWFLQYRAQDTPGREAPGESSSVMRSGIHFFGFRLITNGHQGDWWQTSDYTAMTVRTGWHTDRMSIRISNGNAVLEDVRNEVLETVSLPIPTGQESVMIEAMVDTDDDAAEGGMCIRVDNVFSFWKSRGRINSNHGDHPQRGLITIRHRASMQDIYWSSWWSSMGADDRSEATFQKYARVPVAAPAVLDRGLNRLSHIPQSTYEDAWELVTSLAAAEYGAVFFDEAGVFRFWNRDTILKKQETPVREITPDNAEDLAITNSLDSVRNIITSDVTVATASEKVLYESQDRDEFYVPAETTKVFNLGSVSAQAVNPWPLTRYRGVATGGDFPDWSDNVTHGYVMSFLEVDGTWHENAGAIGTDVRASINSSGELEIRIHNGFPVPTRCSFTGAEGDAALRVEGTAINSEGNIVIQALDSESIDLYGSRNLQLTGDWVQKVPNGVENLPERVVQRTSKPIPATDAVVIAGDPRLQLGDTVWAVDPEGLGERIKLQILGVNRTWGTDTGLTDRLTVEMIEPAGIGLWDSAQYGLWDTTFTWSD